MSNYTPKPDAPIPITLDGTEEMETNSPYADYLRWLKDQYAKGEPVIILYPVHGKWYLFYAGCRIIKTKWYKFVRWVKGIWDKLTGWLGRGAGE